MLNNKSTLLLIQWYYFKLIETNSTKPLLHVFRDDRAKYVCSSLFTMGNMGASFCGWCRLRLGGAWWAREGSGWGQHWGTARGAATAAATNSRNWGGAYVELPYLSSYGGRRGREGLRATNITFLIIFYTLVFLKLLSYYTAWLNKLITYFNWYRRIDW